MQGDNMLYGGRVSKGRNMSGMQRRKSENFINIAAEA
jgi:hypothetical protein